MHPGACADHRLRVFRALGIPITIVETGRCGMYGIFGHEARQVASSRRLFDLSWKDKIENVSTPTQLELARAGQADLVIVIDH